MIGWRETGKGEWWRKVFWEGSISANPSAVRKTQAWKSMGAAFSQKKQEYPVIRRGLDYCREEERQVLLGHCCRWGPKDFKVKLKKALKVTRAWNWILIVMGTVKALATGVLAPVLLLGAGAEGGKAGVAVVWWWYGWRCGKWAIYFVDRTQGTCWCIECGR
jgi:hypothetical protein